MTTHVHGAVNDGDGSPKNRREARFIFATLLLTALLPGLSKAYAGGDAPSESGLNQLLWSAVYIFAAIRVRALVPNLGKVWAKSATLWSFGLLMLFSTLWSVAPFVSISQAIEMIGTMVVGVYIVVRFPLSHFLDILSVVFATIATLSLALVIFAPGRGRVDWGGGAWSGIYQEKNLLGASMALAIVSLIIMLPAARGRKRWRIVGTLIVCSALLVGSNSITATVNCVVALAVSFAALSCLSPRFGVVSRAFIIISGLFAALAILGFDFDPASLPGVFGRSGNLTGRTDFWPYLKVAIADRPLLGYGYDAFFASSVSSDYLAEYVVSSYGWTPYHAHNSFLQILLNAGYVGLALCIVILVQGFSRAVRYIARELSATACWPLAVFVYLVAGSYTESYLMGYNSFESLFLVAAFLYPVRSRLTNIEPLRGRRASERMDDPTFGEASRGFVGPDMCIRES